MQPTVGRVMWFRPNGIHREHFTVLDHEQPCSAQVTYVYNDGRVNLMVSDHNGVTWPFANVVVVQPEEPKPEPGTPFVVWMPYQLGQAAKTEDLTPRVEALENLVDEITRAPAASPPG